MAPAEVPPVPVYAGDTCIFPIYTFQSGGAATNLAAEGWSGWTATWRRDPNAPNPIQMAVDLTAAAAGTIGISATAAQTRTMGAAGVWDLQASRTSEVRTFLRGSTTYLMDVTRD